MSEQDVNGFASKKFKKYMLICRCIDILAHQFQNSGNCSNNCEFNQKRRRCQKSFFCKSNNFKLTTIEQSWPCGWIQVQTVLGFSAESNLRQSSASIKLYSFSPASNFWVNCNIYQIQHVAPLLAVACMYGTWCFQSEEIKTVGNSNLSLSQFKSFMDIVRITGR